MNSAECFADKFTMVYLMVVLPRLRGKQVRVLHGTAAVIGEFPIKASSLILKLAATGHSAWEGG